MSLVPSTHLWLTMSIVVVSIRELFAVSGGFLPFDVLPGIDGRSEGGGIYSLVIFCQQAEVWTCYFFLGPAVTVQG